MNYLFFDEVRASPQTVLRRVCDALDLRSQRACSRWQRSHKNENPVRVDTVVTSEDRRMVAGRCMEDLEWLAERFDGPAKAWASVQSGWWADQRVCSSQASRKASPRGPNYTQAMRQVAEMHGPWVSHNIELAKNLFTIGEEPTGDGPRLRRFLTVTEALLGKISRETRVL